MNHYLYYRRREVDEAKLNHHRFYNYKYIDRHFCYWYNSKRIARGIELRFRRYDD